MRFSNRYFLFTGLVALFSTNHLLAQDSVPAFADFNYIRKSSPWLNSNNGAGLNHYNGNGISSMELFYNKVDGGFKNYYQSNNSQTYGLNADAIKRINPNVVIAGGLSYKNFAGKNMTGSVFMDPYAIPFDIVELDEHNNGKKISELYNLNGSVSAKVTAKLSLGGKLNYEAGNYAKQRDLRHTNKLLNLNASFGALYAVSDGLEVGANYNYDRRIESINFKTYGNTDRIFLSLIDFGSFYGETELFGSTGYTASANTSPLKDITHGASLQLNIKLGDAAKWYNQFTYGDRAGFFGEEGTSSILLTRHNGTNLAYDGTLSLTGNHIEHHINIKADYKYLENKESIYRKGTTEGGLSQINYYGMKEVSTGDDLSIGVDYNVFLAVKNNQPTWALNFKADYLGKDQNTNLYPYYRKQTINSFQFVAQANRQIQRKKDAFNVGLGVGYGSGNGEMANDGVFVEPSEGNAAPTSMGLFLNQEFEYFTSARYQGNVSFQYTKALQNNISAFLKVNYGQTYAPGVAFLGKHLNNTSLSVGFNF